MTIIQAEWLQWPQTQILWRAFPEGSLRFVGGAVRDAVLSRNVQDVDAATTLLPEQTMAVLDKAGIRAIPTGLAHGTVTALVDGKSFEITTLRKDVVTDGRHAQVAYTDSWQEDAARRDFTMNALYADMQGQVFDYFNGQDDARDGRLRFIGDPAKRIGEDYLRILRFFRFHAHYGLVAPDEAALRACAEAAPRMEALSGERVQAELVKLLDAPRAYETLVLMQSYGILAAALGMEVDVPVFARIAEIEVLTGLHVPGDRKLLGLVWNTPVQLAALVARLRLSGKMEKMFRLALEHKTALPYDGTQAGQKALMRKLGAEVFSLLVLFSWAAGPVAVNAQAPYLEMLALAREWQPPVFPVTGEDLIALGVASGKALGERLRALEAAWEASDYVLTKVELLAL